jgi:hypothetical protein
VAFPASSRRKLQLESYPKSGSLPDRLGRCLSSFWISLCPAFIPWPIMNASFQPRFTLHGRSAFQRLLADFGGSLRGHRLLRRGGVGIDRIQVYLPCANVHFSLLAGSRAIAVPEFGLQLLKKTHYGPDGATGSSG